MTIYCVGGTVHCNRLACRDFTYRSIFVRYFEVMLLLTLAMVTLVIFVFFQFGMIASNSGPPPMMRLLVVLSILVAATIPGWKMMRWYYRWPVYVVCVAIAFALLGIRFE